MDRQSVRLETVIDDIRKKRQRQVDHHGWSRAHDDDHNRGELARAAIPYLQAAYRQESELIVFWPWAEPPKLDQSRRELLINAAALIVADIERIDRQS